MKWCYLMQEGILPNAKMESLSFVLGQERQLLSSHKEYGFVTADTAWGRAAMARIAAVMQLPISYNKMHSHPCCVLLSLGLPSISKDSSVCFIGGRGLGSAAEYGVLAEMANQCYASVGATRAVVDSGWAPPEHQIGQGGMAPKVDYAIMIGVSGAIQHIVGLKFAKCIIAINPDPNAAIFEIADYGVVRSWQQAKSFLINSLFDNEKGERYVDRCPKGNKGP